VHDVHLWSIDGQSRALSAHLLVDDQKISQCDAIVGQVQSLLRDRFGIDHATLQVECASCANPAVYCGGIR
jgi:cobalt-zinc-cadmium efflux system protein